MKDYSSLKKIEIYNDMINAIGLMVMARMRMEEVFYVYDALKKYKKLNPMIAESNTRLADRENVAKFDSYAVQAVEIFMGFPPRFIQDSELLQNMAAILLAEYDQESAAVEKRLAIYDSSLLDESKRKRNERKNYIKKYAHPHRKENLGVLKEMIDEQSRLEIQRLRLEKKIEQNQEIYNANSRRIFWRKNARKTMNQAVEFITEHSAELEKNLREKKILDNNINKILNTFMD